MFNAVKIKSRLYMGLASAHADLSLCKLVLFYGPSFQDHICFPLSDHQSLLEHPKFDRNKKTVIYLHGFIENMRVESINVIATAYLQRNDVNIIILDWGQLADGNYMFDAVINIKQLGPELAKILLTWDEDDLFDLSTLHIVGHSLGGQMAGIVGREVYQRSRKTKKLKRITALDPAFPMFYYVKFVTPLNKKDAEFVDIIHTDAWMYGAPCSTGTADFWPNGGATLQPGCPKRNYKLLTDNDLSSHRRSWWFWAESVIGRYPDQFECVRAKSWSDFKEGRLIASTEKVVMGHDCPTNISGDYYLQTNGVPPYARGRAGTIFVETKELVGGICTENNN